MYFTTTELMAEASRITGLKDFGEDNFMEGFEILLADINEQQDVPPDRVEPLKKDLLRMLINRQWFGRDLAMHPEIRDQEMQPPVAIVSMPRTGTTKLQRLLSATPSFHNLLFWQGRMFARIPGEADGGVERRIRETREYEAWMEKVAPEFMQGHPMHTEDAEEDLTLNEHTFKTGFMIGRFNAPNYAAWFLQTDMRSTYHYQRLQMQYLQWQFYQDQPKPWLLKAPAHLGFEAELSNAFPEGVKFICPHRKPSEVLPSASRIAELFTQLYSAQAVPKHIIGAAQLGGFGQMMENHLRWRDAHPEAELLDLSFKDITNDSIATAEKVYDFLGRDFTTDMKDKIAKWDKQHPRNKFGKLKYSLDMFGLDEKKVNDTFAEYSERFADYL